MTSRARTGTVLAAALVVVLLGCSGSKSSSDTTGATPSSDSTASASTATTGSPDTTTTSSTTTTSTTTATTTAEPAASTTTESVEPTGDEVADGLIASREAYLYAVYNLDAPDAVDRLNATHAAGSPSLELALDNVKSLVNNGWLARPNPDIPDTITIESDVTMLDDATAELIACVVGAGEVYAPGAGDGGADLIINGEIEAALNRITMVLEDGQWKLREGTNLSTESGTECVVE